MPRSTSSSARQSRASSFGSSLSSRPSSHGSSSRPTTPIAKSPSVSGISAPYSTPVGSPALQPSFGQTIKEGFGFGIGSALAHRIFGGTRVVEHVHTTQPSQNQIQTQSHNPEYVKCMNESNQDTEACKHLLNDE